MLKTEIGPRGRRLWTTDHGTKGAKLKYNSNNLKESPVDLQPLTTIQQNNLTPQPPHSHDPITLTVCVTTHPSTTSRQHHFHQSAPLYMEGRIFIARRPGGKKPGRVVEHSVGRRGRRQTVDWSDLPREARFWERKLGPPRHTTCGGWPLPNNPTYSAFWSVFGVTCPDCNGWPRRWASGQRCDWHPGRTCRIPS